MCMCKPKIRFARDSLHILDNRVVALIGINFLFSPIGKRMRVSSGEAQTVFARQSDDGAAKLTNFFARLLNVVANARADLDHALMHLGLYRFLELDLALSNDLGINVRAQIARHRIDGLILFLDTDGEAWAGHDRKLAQRISTIFGSFRASSTAYSATASTIQSKFF